MRRLQTKYNFSPSDDIYAMDETAVEEVMVATTTVNKKGSIDVVMQSTGHEKAIQDCPDYILLFSRVPKFAILTKNCENCEI